MQDREGKHQRDVKNKRGVERRSKNERESMPASVSNSIKKHEKVSGSAARER